MNTLAKLGAVGLCAGTFFGSAYAQPAAEHPAFKVGDKWEFKQSSADGKTSNWSREIIDVPSAERLRVRLGSGKVEDYDGAMNLLPEGDSERARVLGKYPFKVGDTWAFSRKFANPSFGEVGNAKVVAFESLTVPAGTFKCYRVEAEASLTNNRSALKENRTWIRWYCPEVKWLAKEVVETKTSTRGKGSSATVETSELIKFTPGK